MKVKEALQYIDNIERTIDDMLKFQKLSYEERKGIQEKLELQGDIMALVNISVNCMSRWKNVLKDKVDNAEI